jgi:hypothetical protein
MLLLAGSWPLLPVLHEPQSELVVCCWLLWYAVVCSAHCWLLRPLLQVLMPCAPLLRTWKCAVLGWQCYVCLQPILYPLADQVQAVRVAGTCSSNSSSTPHEISRSHQDVHILRMHSTQQTAMHTWCPVLLCGWVYFGAAPCGLCTTAMCEAVVNTCMCTHSMPGLNSRTQHSTAQRCCLTASEALAFGCVCRLH